MSIRISKNAWVSSALVPSILTTTKEPPATVSDARAMVPTDTEPPSGPAGSHEGQRPTLRPEEVSETPQDTTMAEPPEPEKPAEPEKVEDKKEAPKTEEQREPDPKPQIDDEHPLQERVPLSPDHAEPKEEVPGKDPKAEPKAAEKSGKAKPSLFDRMMGFIVGKPSVPPPDPAGAVSFSSVMLWNAFDGHMQSRFPERSSDLSRSIQHDNKTYSFHYTHIPVQL